MSEAEVLAATERVVGRRGPEGMTLAAVGAESGLAAATLVQRYGSKRGLLLAFAAASAAEAARPFREARAAHASPLAALYAALRETARGVESPASMAGHLALFRLDVTDAEFGVHARAHAATVRAEIGLLLSDAAAAGELARCDTTVLARTVHTVFNGALLTWALAAEGELGGWIAADVAAVLRPWLP